MWKDIYSVRIVQDYFKEEMTMGISAYGAMVAILDINETIEGIKTMNNTNPANPVLCKTTGLLADYREVLIEAMENTEIKFGGKDNDSSRVKDTDSGQ